MVWPASAGYWRCQRWFACKRNAKRLLNFYFLCNVMEKENNRNVVGVKEGRLSSKPIKMRDILPFSRSTHMSWFCSVCEKSLSRKDSIQRHVMAKQRKACLTPFQTVAMPSKILSVVLLRAFFHLHGYLG